MDAVISGNAMRASRKSPRLRFRDVMRRMVPWWAKAGLKLGMAYVPQAYFLLRPLGLARHGEMDDPTIAFDIFHRHFDNVDFHNKSAGFTALELGPGDSLASAVIARAYGAQGSCFVDVGPFANTDIRVYQQMAEFLRNKGMPAPDLADATSFDEVLHACGARYETEGLASLKRLPDASFDLIFSNAVMQAINEKEFPETLRELRRLLKPGGASIHSIDLRDMMGQSLHHLRFSEKTWESKWFKRAGFHTNRLRLSELIELHRQAGFETELNEVNRWPEIPVPRRKLAAPYRDMPKDELRVATVRLVCRPAATL